MMPHRRTSSIQSKRKRQLTHRDRIIFFIAVGLVVNMGVALRLEKPIENGTVKKAVIFDYGAHSTEYMGHRRTNEQNEIALRRMCSLPSNLAKKKIVKNIFCEQRNILFCAAPSERQLENF